MRQESRRLRLEARHEAARPSKASCAPGRCRRRRYSFCHSKHGGVGAELSLCAPFSRARVWVVVRHHPIPGRERRLPVTRVTSVLGWDGGSGGGSAEVVAAELGDPAAAAPARRVRGALGGGPRRWGSCAGATAELWAGLQCGCGGAFGPAGWAEVRWVTAFLQALARSFSSAVPVQLCPAGTFAEARNALCFLMFSFCESPRCVKQFSE